MSAETGYPVAIEEVYVNDGSELSAASLGVRYGNSLLIGSVTTRALYCQLLSVDTEKH